MYRKSPAQGALRQGEILSDVVEYQIVLETLPLPEKKFTPRRHPYAIVLAQDCDLDWDYRAQRKIQGENHSNAKVRGKLEARRTPNILLCEGHTAKEIRGRDDMDSRILQQISINKNERYHFFQQIPADADLLGKGLPELALDFKKYLAIPTDELYWQITSGDAERRTCLCSPYLEHLSHRFTSFLSRVALPEDYESMTAGEE